MYSNIKKRKNNVIFRFFITAKTFEFFCDCPHNPSNID